MKRNEFVNMLLVNNDDIKTEIKRGNYYLNTKNYKRASEKFKIVGKYFVSKGLFLYASEFYEKSASALINGGSYYGAINSQETAIEIYNLLNDKNKVASGYEKIASWHKYYLNDKNKAGSFYYISAKVHEENQNYYAAYKKAKFAYKCFEESGPKRKFLDSIGLATRMALQANHLERAGSTVIKWHENVEHDYSSAYLSICMKGYKSFKKANRNKDALIFLNEIINAHYNGKKQENIISYLIEAQELTVGEHNRYDEIITKKLLEELKQRFLVVSNYFRSLRKIADDTGDRDLADLFFSMENKYKKLEYRKKNKYFNNLVYGFWNITSKYGTSTRRWISCSILIVLFFGAIFSNFPCPNFYPIEVKKALCFLAPSIKITSIDNNFSPFYFSVVTFTTLGFGDITPLNLSAQILIVLEVIFGYLMLGGLITIFFRKIIR